RGVRQEGDQIPAGGSRGQRLVAGGDLTNQWVSACAVRLLISGNQLAVGDSRANGKNGLRDVDLKPVASAGPCLATEHEGRRQRNEIPCSFAAAHQECVAAATV